MINLSEEGSCFVKSDYPCLFNFFKNVRLFNENATFDSQIKNVCDDAGNCKAQSTGTRSHQNTNSSFYDPANIADRNFCKRKA